MIEPKKFYFISNENHLFTVIRKPIYEIKPSEWDYFSQQIHIHPGDILCIIVFTRLDTEYAYLHSLWKNNHIYVYNLESIHTFEFIKDKFEDVTKLMERDIKINFLLK